MSGNFENIIANLEGRARNVGIATIRVECSADMEFQTLAGGKRRTSEQDEVGFAVKVELRSTPCLEMRIAPATSAVGKTFAKEPEIVSVISGCGLIILGKVLGNL